MASSEGARGVDVVGETEGSLVVFHYLNQLFGLLGVVLEDDKLVAGTLGLGGDGEAKEE